MSSAKILEGIKQIILYMSSYLETTRNFENYVSDTRKKALSQNILQVLRRVIEISHFLLVKEKLWEVFRCWVLLNNLYNNMREYLLF